MNMTRKSIMQSAFVIGILAGTAIYPAQAGFQFTAPVQQVQPSTQNLPPVSGSLLPSMSEDTATTMPSAPNAPVNSQPLTANNPSPSPSMGMQSLPAAPNTQSMGNMNTPEAMPQQMQQTPPRNRMAPPASSAQTVNNPAPRAPQTGLSSLAPANAAPMSLAPSRNAAAQNQTPSSQSDSIDWGSESQTSMDVASSTNTDYEIAAGFGQDLPLVTALRQVVPDDYTYVLEDSVPMGQNVSWNGGRPWNQVLGDMIAPLGLRAYVNNKRVIITTKDINQTSGQTQVATQVQRPDNQYAMASNTMPTTTMSDASAPKAMMPPIANNNYPQAQAMPAYAPIAPQLPSVPMQVEGVSSVSQFSAPSEPLPSRVVPQVTRGSWTAQKGDSLRSVLEEWTGQAGAELFWSSDYDYPLAGDVNVSGTFEEATENLLSGFEQARPKPVARLHPNLPHGPAVLVVETRQTLE